MTDDANPLGVFLRARRERVDPASLDLPAYGRRRTAGLRREEVAFLAGVSSHYYARLEQGRNRNPSLAVVDAVGRVLGLDEQELAHLRHLAEPKPRQRSRPAAPEIVRPGLRRLFLQWADQPVVLVGRYRDVLESTPLAQLINPGFVPGRNLLRDTFLNPSARDVYLDWDDVAAGAVAGIRASAGTDLDDPRLTDLVGELSLKSPDFQRLWARHDVAQRTDGAKRYNTPTLGEVELFYETFTITGSAGQTLFVFFAEPGSPHEQSLKLLATTIDEPRDLQREAPTQRSMP